MSELAKRWAVAAVGVPTVLGLLYLGGWFIAVPLAVIAAWGAHECYRLAAARDVRPLKVVGSTGAAVLVLLAAWRPDFAAFAPWALGVIGVSAVVAVVASLVVRGPEGSPLSSIAVTLFGTVYAGLSLSFVPLLFALPRELGWGGGDFDAWAGVIVVALPLASTWIGDAAAFFAGSAWGREGKKLAPTISPNKSWVGFWADLIGGAVAAVLWLWVAQTLLPSLRTGGFVALALAGATLGFVAVVGDLVESLLKREAGVKDSGAVFPGHGGVLDRIDSLIFTFPTAYVVLVLLGALA